MEDLTSFKRVRAIINETLRLRPPAWTVPRWTDKDVKIGQYDVPANTIVEVNLTIIHRNPKYWKNPNDFIPRRWTDEEETSRHPFAFVPFSAGARNCVGKNFAIQEMIIALSIVLSHFTIELDPARPMRAKGNPVPLPDCYVKFHPRK
jgi:enediyne biosynthesis protein E7